jgi:hypothetical protein
VLRLQANLPGASLDDSVSQFRFDPALTGFVPVDGVCLGTVTDCDKRYLRNLDGKSIVFGLPIGLCGGIKR